MSGSPRENIDNLMIVDADAFFNGIVWALKWIRKGASIACSREEYQSCVMHASVRVLNCMSSAHYTQYATHRVKSKREAEIFIQEFVKCIINILRDNHSLWINLLLFSLSFSLFKEDASKSPPSRPFVRSLKRLLYSNSKNWMCIYVREIRSLVHLISDVGE